MGFDFDSALNKYKEDRAEQQLKPKSTPADLGKIGGQAAGKVTKQSAPAIAQAKNTQRYGNANPTAADVSKQAEAIAQWDTDMDVTTFLNQAVSDGVVTSSEAESIFRKTTGGSLFSQQNQQKMVSEATRLMNGGTPVWMTRQIEEEFGNYTPEQMTAKMEELTDKDKLTPYEKAAISYFAAKTLSREKLSNTSGKYASKAGEIKGEIEMSPETMAVINMYPEAFRIKESQGVYSYTLIDEDFLEKRGYTPEEIASLKKELNVLSHQVVGMNDAIKKAEDYANKAVMSNFLELEKMSSVTSPEASNYDENYNEYVKKGKALQYDKSGETEFKLSKGGLQIDNKRALAMVLAERNGQSVPNLRNQKLDAYRMAKDEELNLFAYYLAKDLETGGNEAGRYADLLEDEMALRWGRKDSEERTGFFPNLGLTALTGLEQYAQGIERNFDKKEYYPITPYQASTMYTTEGLRKEGRNFAATAMDLGVTAFNMAPSILLSTALSMVLSPAVGKLAAVGTKGATFGAKALSYAPGIAGNLSMGLSARGNAYAQMINQGYSTEQATAYGNMIMASEVALQSVLGGISKLGGISPKVAKAISQVDNALVRLAIQYPVAFTGEATEEGLQAFLEPLFEEIALGYDTGKEIDWGQIAYEAFLGGLMGGIFESPEIITSNGKVYIQDRATGRKINLNDNLSTLIYEAKKDAGSKNYKRATKLENGKKVSDAKVGALLRHMVEDGQISEADARTLVTEGLNGAPLDEAEQAYFYAGARGIGINEAAKLNSNLTVDPDRAIAAWQMGAEKRKANDTARIRAGKVYTETDSKLAEAVNKNTERPKEIEKTKETPVVQNEGNVVETPAVQNGGRAKSIVRENYNKAAEEFRTEENAELFDVAYNQGLLGEKLNLGVIVPDKDISAVSQAYVAGTRDARIISERRANFDNRTPGLFTDAVTEQLSKKIGSRTINAIDALGKKLGVQIRLIQRGEAGHEKDSYYSPSKGIIAINVNEIHGKLTGDKLIRFIANHEGVHRIRETSPNAYAEMEKIALSKSKQTVEDRMARFGESKERATEEIVADYFGEVLTSKAEIKTLLNEHRSVFDAIMEALEWLVDKMRGIANYSFSEIAEARKLFQEALEEANADVWGKDVREDESGSFGENEVVLSRSTYDEEGRDKLINWLNNSKLEKSERDRIVSQLDFIYDITTKYTNKFTVFGKWSQAEVLKGEDGKPVLSVVKQNGEYKLNLDFSSVCSKRRPLDTIITKMVESGIINDVLIDENGLVKLNQIINKHGLTVACALCYVEGRRYRQEKVAKDFANLYNGLVDRYNENPTDFAKRILAEQPLNDKGGHKETVDYKIAKHLETHSDERKHIDYTDFMSSEGFTKVAKENPELLKLYNSKKGTGGPKAAFADVQYLNEILSKKAFNAKTAFAVGGVRIQSFSDFVPRLVFDYAQMVADLDAKKLPAHAYTKVVDFVKIFGLTGIKINMSLIPKYVKGGVAPGLDANGNYAWDAESFDFDTAIEIQSDEGYSKNCGTIAVGVSYGHIMKLLADDRIKMVIPYHKSGINPIVAKMLEISAYEDYTESQTTKHNDGTALTAEEKKKEFNFNEVMHRGLTAKEAADEYLKWCDKKENDYRPKFAEFRDNENYYKLLADFSCYDVNGEYSPQTAVKMNYPDNVDALIGEAIGKDQSNEDAILREADGIIEEFSAWNKTRDDDGVLWSRSEDSEANVKYFPPGEDPRRDIKVPSEVNGKKVRRFTRTAAESPALTPEMAEALVDRITTTDIATYEVSSNKALADNAMNKVENDVIQAASEWKTAFDSGKRITDKDIALGEALIIEAGKRGDTERAIELISEVAIAATEAGKVVQAIKLLKRMTPEGQVYYLSKVVERLNKERGKTKGKEFNKSIEAENKATEADKKYKQAEAKVKTAEEKLFDIETAIKEYTKDLDIEVKIAESVKKVADLKKKLSEAKGKVKSADASSEKLGDNIKEIEGQLEEERKKLKEAMTKRDAILKERAEKGIMLSKLKAGVKRVDNATDHVLGEIDILEDDISKIEAEYDKAVKFRDECAEERRRLIKERNFLIKDTEAAEKASERYSKEISQLEEQISELSDKYIAAKSAAIQASLIRKQLKAERNELSSKLAKIENAIDWENENRETEIAKLKEEIAQLLNAEYEASKELEKAKEERTLKQKAKDKARKLSSAAKMGANIIELPADIKKAILESKNEEELNESVELAKDYIAENMVTTKAEMIRVWRYLSMLGNLRTQVRNIIGNGFMLLNVLQKNAVATPIETVAVYASHKNLEKKLAKMKADGATEAELTAYRDEHYAERTKTWTLFKKKSAELKDFVTESWESNIKLAKGQSGKNDNIIGDINDRRTIFKSEKPVLKQVAAGVEAWRKATNWAMERGDEVFLRINYKHALTSYILSNKWDVATMTEAQKLRAEQYALKEAQEATFRDDSGLADLINKARNKGWGYELAIGGLMPFTKTPINITKRSIEYGPTGIVNAIAQGVKAAKGEATSSDVVNALAKTFSGSALAGLGFYLAAKGLLRSKGDEEDEEYNYLIGEQDYSLIIGDYRFSIEWAAPAAVPLLFGASIYNAWFEKDGGTKEEYMVDENGNIVLNTNSMATHKVMNAVSTMFAPIFEASYLSGLTDSVGAAFSFGSGDASEGLAIFGINAGLSYANQFIPTVFGQIARTIDPVERRNNDYDKTSILPYSVQRGIEKSKNKIPFLNQTSTPYVNAWGEEEIKKGALDYILSGAENFVLPGYIEKITDDELTDELWRLQKTEAAEEKKVFPESVGTSYKEDGETLPLTAEQRNKRQKVAGQKGREYIEAFYNSDEYGKLTDAEKVEAIDLLWAKANEEGIQAVSPDYASSDTNVERLNYAEKNIGISPEDYALWKIAYERANEDGNSSYNMDEVDAALDIFVELSGEEWTDEQLGYLWQQRSTALSNKNPYGYALRGTPWYKAKQADGQTWKNER